jgi:hypothetical protein
MLPLTVLAVGSLALQADNPELPYGMRCRAAAEQEIQYGSKVVSPDLEKALQHGGGAFQRLFRGSPASIIHLCNRGVLVVRLIYVDFESWHAAKLAYESYVSSFTRQFGRPCGNGSPVEIEKLGLEWKTHGNAAVNLTVMPPRNRIPQLVINARDLSLSEHDACKKI